LKGSERMHSVLIPITKDTRTMEDIFLAKKGDKVSFERLIQQNDISLYRVAKGILRHEHDIEDAYQETIIKAYKGIAYLKREQFFKTWLLRIMINECNMILRRRRKTAYIDETVPEDIAFEDNHERLELWQAVNTLKEELRIVVILFYYEGFLQNQIAELLDIPVGTVKSRLSKARENLKEDLEIKL
jgi:RNA polymerase sigma-70 factor (ECF subfamily)